MRWNFWALAYWMFWVFAFVVWEAYAGSKQMGGGDIPMLTQAFVRYVPWWLGMPFLTWLWWHFAVRYHSSQYIQWLRGR